MSLHLIAAIAAVWLAFDVLVVVGVHLLRAWFARPHALTHLV